MAELICHQQNEYKYRTVRISFIITYILHKLVYYKKILQTMAELSSSDLLSESLNIIDPFDFDGEDVSPKFMSSPFHVQKSQEMLETSAMNVSHSQSINSSQKSQDLFDMSGMAVSSPSQPMNSTVDTSGLLLQHIDTQKEVR